MQALHNRQTYPQYQDVVFTKQGMVRCLMSEIILHIVKETSETDIYLNLLVTAALLKMVLQF